MATWLTDLDVPHFSKLRIIFINVFCVLYKAATLNLSKLFKDLQAIEKAFPSRSSLPVFVLQKLIPLFLLLKFVAGFFSLTARVVAMLPILSNDHPEILLPSIFSQIIDNLLLPAIELLLGYVAAKYTLGDCTVLLIPFTIFVVLKILVGVIILNLYMSYFSEIHAACATTSERCHVRRFESEERFLNKESLS